MRISRLFMLAMAGIALLGIGCNSFPKQQTDEAIQAVTYFIDDAIQVGAIRVRILHGTGNGILRQLIRQYLHTVPQVISARDEDVRFGGAGITVVQIK